MRVLSSSLSSTLSPCEYVLTYDTVAVAMICFPKQATTNGNNISRWFFPLVKNIIFVRPSVWWLSKQHNVLIGNWEYDREGQRRGRRRRNRENSPFPLLIDYHIIHRFLFDSIDIDCINLNWIDWSQSIKLVIHMHTI